MLRNSWRCQNSWATSNRTRGLSTRRSNSGPPCRMCGASTTATGSPRPATSGRRATLSWPPARGHEFPLLPRGCTPTSGRSTRTATATPRHYRTVACSWLAHPLRACRSRPNCDKRVGMSCSRSARTRACRGDTAAWTSCGGSSRSAHWDGPSTTSTTYGGHDKSRRSNWPATEAFRISTWLGCVISVSS